MAEAAAAAAVGAVGATWAAAPTAAHQPDKIWMEELKQYSGSDLAAYRSWMDSAADPRRVRSG
jgi:hypothetical protein